MTAYRFLILFLAIGVLFSASTVFAIKKDAERAGERAGRLTRQITEEKAKISELRAAWSVADDPGRLQQLVDQHQDLLALKPIEAAQIGTFQDIPRRPPEPPVDPLAGSPGAAAATGR
ncbi:hypothetical protein AB7M35_001360 [Amorphus suaedae]